MSAIEMDVSPDRDYDKLDETQVECQLKIWLLQYKKDGKQESVPGSTLDEKPSTPEPKSAVEVTRIFDRKNVLESTKVEINSHDILKALRKAVVAHPTVAADFTEPFEMTDPFYMLFHHWNDIEKYKESMEDDRARMHVAVLLDFMQSELGAERERFRALSRSGRIDYARLWMNYLPEAMVITEVQHHRWQLRVMKTAYEEDPVDGPYFQVSCAFTDYDGNDFVESEYPFRIYQRDYFGQQNPVEITDLPVFPREYLLDCDDLEDHLYKRGTQFLSFTNACVREYEGPAEYLKEKPWGYYDPKEDNSHLVWLSFAERGRVVIDRRTFHEDRTRSVSKRLYRGDTDRTLCPPFVMGFSASRKGWCRFFLPNLNECNWQQEPFDKLIMPDDQKSLLRALLKGHDFSEYEQGSAQQKGKGLVFLLYGAPGSGKTLTAECSAELTQSALFNTSMSELNQHNYASAFEHELKKVLRYATRWKAIVLLDEADVFLEARDGQSVERNAIVAVFLRQLEYFSGIVFLTTNRTHTFDPAMRSRIHVALKYSAPGRESRRRIWSYALMNLAKEGRDFNVEAVLDELSAVQMDGREIANVVTTACSWSRFNSRPVTMLHIRKVIQIRDDFMDSLKELKASGD